MQGKVGDAMSCWEGEEEKKTVKLRLEDNCTVCQAELLALNMAIEMAEKSKNKKIAIFSDSRSALDLISNPSAFHGLAHEIKETVLETKRRGVNFNFYWVKAHVGIPGNARANELAKEAALYNKKKTDYDKFPVSYAKRLIRQN